MLGMLQAAVEARDWPLARIDGSLGADQRAKNVARFQKHSNIPIFLLSSQVIIMMMRELIYCNTSSL